MAFQISKQVIITWGPVVQSIISLTKLLVEDSLSLNLLKKSIAVVFLAEKLHGAFAMQNLIL